MISKETGAKKKKKKKMKFMDKISLKIIKL